MAPKIGRPRTRPDSEYAEWARKYAASWYERNKHRFLNKKKAPERYAELRIKDRARRLRNRRKVIDLLGSKCQCCGESNWELLAIDHIHGDGAYERNVLGYGGTRIVTKVMWDDNRTERYRLLCHNCNSALKFYGYCPHQGGAPF